MNLQNVFAVRHRVTKRVLPQSYLKGGTYWEPVEETFAEPPRLFYSRRSAQGFIAAWAQGHAKPYTETEEGFSGPITVASGVFYEPCGRTRDELEIVELELKEATP